MLPRCLVCTLKFKKHCCRGKVIFPSTSWARAIFAEHMRSGTAYVYERILLYGQPILVSLIFAAAGVFLISSLQIISIHFESFPHQLGISPLALGSATNCACLRLTGCETTVENCKRSQEYCPVQKPRGLDAFWKAREFELSKALGPSDIPAVC